MATNIPMNTLEHVTYQGTELNAFSAGGCEWRKPYALTIPTKPTGVASITVTRSASESNCGQVTATSLTSSGTVLYGDTLSISGSGATGYNDPIATFDKDISIAVTFPATSKTTTANLYGSANYGYYAEVSRTNTYNDYSDYTSCTMYGNTLDTTYTTLYQVYSTNTDNTKIYTTRSAKFVDGVLTVQTTVTYWVSETQAVTVPASDELSSTATFTQNLTTITVTGDVTVGVTAGTGKTYYVYYKQGTASSTTNLPSTQSRVYPNAVTLATNSMTRNGVATAGYTVTLNYNGNGTANATLTSTKVTSYTANGWTTTSGSTTCNYANGATFGTNLATDLTLYPCFSETVTDYPVTLPTPTRDGYEFKGWGTSATAGGGYTGSYTPTSNITLYALWEVSLSVSVLFPAVAQKSTTIGTGSTSNGYTFTNSSTKTYSGYGDYTICTIDGIGVGTSYTSIKTTYSTNNSLEKKYVAYSAKFVDGTLTTRTVSTYWVNGSAYQSGIAYTIPAGASYSTNAVFSGCELTLQAPDVGACFLESSNLLYMKVSNYNDVAVICCVTAYDGYGDAYGAEEVTINGDTYDEIIYVDLSSSLVDGFVELHFEANGYNDSDTVTAEF